MDFRGRHLPLFVCALLLFYVPTVGAQSTGTVTGTVLGRGKRRPVGRRERLHRDPASRRCVGHRGPLHRQRRAARPNSPADLSINPCLVPGDRSCIDESGRYIGSGAGPFTLTNGYFPYEEYQGLHRRHDEIERGEESHFVSGQRHRRFLRSGGHRACAVNRVS